MIYNNCIDTGIFPDLNGRNLILFQFIEGDKQLLQKYRPVSLLPILGKILLKILFNSIFEYLQESNLLCENQQVFDHTIHVNISFFP